jgi:hypothetical protein
MRGDGIMSSLLLNPFISKQISKKMLEGRPRILHDLLSKYGQLPIEKIEICRKPIVSMFRKILNVATFGKLNREMSKLGYDDLFHLYMVLYLSDGSIWILEKNQRVNVTKGKISGGECKSINYGKKNLGDFINTAERLDIPGFYRYSAFKDNCQKWIKDILNANDITNMDTFVLQNVSTLAPNIVQNISQGITDVAGVADYVMRGGCMKCTKCSCHM